MPHGVQDAAPYCDGVSAIDDIARLIRIDTDDLELEPKVAAAASNGADAPPVDAPEQPAATLPVDLQDEPASAQNVESRAVAAGSSVIFSGRLTVTAKVHHLPIDDKG